VVAGLVVGGAAVARLAAAGLRALGSAPPRFAPLCLVAPTPPGDSSDVACPVELGLTALRLIGRGWIVEVLSAGSSLRMGGLTPDLGHGVYAADASVAGVGWTLFS
jgi:hypothetical protein